MTERSDPPASAGGDDDADAIWNEATAKPEADAARSESEPDSEDKGTTESAEDFAEDTSGSDEPDFDSVLEQAPEPVRSAFTKMQETLKRLEQSEKSQRGRYIAAQRQLDAIKSNRPQEPAGQKDDDDPTKGLEALAEDYPEIAAPIRKVVDHLGKQLEAVNGYVQQTEDGRIAQEQAHVLEEHPDFTDVLKEHGTLLDQWVEDQPRAIRDAYDVNANSIVDGAAARLVMTEFKKHLANQGLFTPPKGGANHTAALRERQRAGADTPAARRSGPSRSGVPREGDPDQIWDAITR